MWAAGLPMGLLLVFPSRSVPDVATVVYSRPLLLLQMRVEEALVWAGFKRENIISFQFCEQ